VDGNYRYGYITEVLDRGFTIGISLFEEGESKIAYDKAQAIALGGLLIQTLNGEESVDYVSLLTETEKRLVPHLARGFNTNEIAASMHISPTTVRAHLRTLRIKMHLEDRAQLIALARGLETMIEKQAAVDRAVELEMVGRR